MCYAGRYRLLTCRSNVIMPSNLSLCWFIFSSIRERLARTYKAENKHGWITATTILEKLKQQKAA